MNPNLNDKLHEYFSFEEYWYGVNLIFNPRFFGETIKALVDIDFSRRFLNSNETDELANKWSEKGIYEGLPNITTTIKDDHNGGLLTRLLRDKVMEKHFNFIRDDYFCPDIKLKSLVELVSLLQLMVKASPTKIRNTLFSGTNYLNEVVSRFAIEVLKIAADKSEKGLIVVLDMTKSTPYIIKGEREKKLETHVEKLYHSLTEIGNTIWLCENKSKYWISGGDTFISFTPIDETHEIDQRGKLAKVLLALIQKLKELKAEKEISFKGGAHFGNLMLLGEEIYSNKEIIIATRTQQFCKKDGSVIITEDIVKKLLNSGELKDLHHESRMVVGSTGIAIEMPQILLDGKPTVWVRPRQVSISIEEREVYLYEIVEEFNI